MPALLAGLALFTVGLALPEPYGPMLYAVGLLGTGMGLGCKWAERRDR